MEKLIIPSILTVSDVIPLCERILKTTQPLTENDNRVKELHTRLSLVYDRLVKNQKNTNKSILTEELIRLDKQRARAFIALRDILHGMSVSLCDDYNNKASKLYAIIDKYGTQLYKFGYQAETAMLTSLFADFDLTENRLILTDLNIVPFYESLESAQKEFYLVSYQKAEELTDHSTNSEAASGIIQELFPELTSLVAMISLYYHLDPPKYGLIYNQMVTYITETNTVARQRKSRRENSAESAEKGTTGT